MTKNLPDFDKKWDYENPTVTEATFRDLLSETSTKDNDPWRLQLLTQIARAEGLQGKFDDAHKTLDDVEAKLGKASPVVQIRYLLERGRVFNSASKPGPAKKLFNEAWETARNANEDFHAVDAAHMLSIVEQGQEALSWNEQALKVAEESSDERANNWRGSLYNNIGWTHHDAGDFAKALGIFQSALTWREKQGDERAIRLARWCVARALRSLCRVPEAQEIQRALQAEHDANGTTDGFVLEELAECSLDLNRLTVAKEFFAAAYQALSQDSWLAENEPDRIARLKDLGGV